MTVSGWSRIPVDESLALDVWSRHGDLEHPVALITAGVHGDEYEGPAAVLQLTQTLASADLKGAVIAIPVVNPPAFEAGTRTSPGDGLNLAREFPGNPQGSITQRLAAQVFEQFAQRSNYLIDLHSGGVEYTFLPLAGFYGEPEDANPSYAAARRFGLPILWRLPPTPGVLSYEAWRRGIVSIGHEYMGAGQLSPEGASRYAAGALSCLRYWGLAAGGPPFDPGGEIYEGDWQLAPAAGLFTARCRPGDWVEAGAVVAEIQPVPGDPFPIHAEREGKVLGLRSKAYIRTGNQAVLVGKRVHG